MATFWENFGIFSYFYSATVHAGNPEWLRYKLSLKQSNFSNFSL